MKTNWINSANVWIGLLQNENPITMKWRWNFDKTERYRNLEKFLRFKETLKNRAAKIFFSGKCAIKSGKIYSPTPFESATKALKLEEDFSSGGCMSAMSMYPSDKMKMSAPGCFTGRYSPTSYRNPDQMRRCMTNPSVSSLIFIFFSCFCA